MRRLPRGLFAVALASLLVSVAWAVDRERAASRVLNDLKYLASDELQGRNVGTEGIEKAAEYIRRAFQQAGLNVTAVDGSAFQEFTVVTGAKLGRPNRLALQGPKNRWTLQLDQDFRPCSFGASGKLDAPLVFVGYGIEAPKQGYDDFEGVDVRGKAVVVLRRTPRWGERHNPLGSTRRASLRTKVVAAHRHGAVAVLFVNDPNSTRQAAQRELNELKDHVVRAAQALVQAEEENFPSEKVAEARSQLQRAVHELRQRQQELRSGNLDRLMPFGYGGSRPVRPVPVFHISQAVCSRMLKAATGKTLQQLAEQIDEQLKPASCELTGWRVVGQATVEPVRAKVKNVVGVLEGEGPLADETIVVGAHYDHLGLGGFGSLAGRSGVVHNGADDNASGVVGLIELARRLASRPKPLPRRVVFVAFTAEERGLLGSAYYVNHPLFPLDKTVAMFNLDMIGRLRENKLTVFGAGTAPRWKPLLEKLAEQGGLKLVEKDSGFGPSDQSSFYSKKVPVLHFFTGLHRDYHRPSDDWDKINVEGLLRVVDLVEQMVVATAERAERPKYVAVKRPAKRKPGEQNARPYVGTIPDFGAEGPGYAISGVAPGSPAEKAGLHAGDRIVEWNGEAVESLEDFDAALRRSKPGDEVELTVRRKGQTVKLKVRLGQPR